VVWVMALVGANCRFATLMWRWGYGDDVLCGVNVNVEVMSGGKEELSLSLPIPLPSPYHISRGLFSLARPFLST
jgi:hypothetical protein